MEFKKINNAEIPYTALLYCAPGVGKSTAIGLIAEASEGNTLVLDVDRTITRTLAKGEVVKNTDKVMTFEIENRRKSADEDSLGTFAAWEKVLNDLAANDCQLLRENNIKTVAVDNISELERCILADLGSQGKNKGVPAMADYQYMQFALVNSLRKMKSWGVNIVLTAWENVRQVVALDGSAYSQFVPKISAKIVDNICGLCDVVGKILAKSDEAHTRGIILEATQTIYAKNQIDARKGCLVADFTKFQKTNKNIKKEA